MTGPTLEEVIAAVEDSMTSLDNPGFCKACGEYQDGCEPDATSARVVARMRYLVLRNY